MSSVDIELLLQSIPGDNPAGENMRFAGLYDDLREARRSDDTLNQGDWKRERKLSDWWQVYQLANDALATRTKDLQVAAWLAEAMIKLHGFAGLRDGFKLMRGLHERFWEVVYPEIDEGDEEGALEGRINAVDSLNRSQSLPLAIQQ